jgi:D-3-phosphoglycerate dehydrogenase / 2-oxoglutarate reductase
MISKVALIGFSSIEGPSAIPGWVTQTFLDSGIEFVAQQCDDATDLAQYAADADIVWILGGDRILTPDNLHVLENCIAILRTGSGTDNIPVNAATECGILVVNTPEAIADIVADHTIGLIFAFTRGIVHHDRLVRQKIWNPNQYWPRWHLAGNSLGLIGFGQIAQKVVERLSKYNMHCYATDPYVSSETMHKFGVKKVSLDELLAKSDFISLHCPLTDETRHLIGSRELRLMKPEAILVNSSRGGVIDEQALIKAVREGWIGGAALDVLEQEPPDWNNPIFGLENVIITPHIGAYSDQFMPNFWRCSVDAILRMRRGQWPLSRVNPQVKLRRRFLKEVSPV